MRDDWSTLRKLMFQRMAAGGSLKEYEAEGNPAVFQTNVVKPLAGFTIPFLPVQQGTSGGDPSPSHVCPISGWQGLTAWRTGINVWDEETELGGINSSTGQPYAATGAIRAKNYIPVVPGASYYLKAPSMTGFTGCWYDKDKNYISTTYQVNNAKAAPNNAYFFRFGLPSSYGTTYNHDISINYPSTETEYHPYTGQSYPVTFPALGKNLLNIYQTNKIAPGVQGSTITISNGVISIDAVATSARSYVLFSQELQAGTYTIQGKTSGAVSGLRLLSSVEISGSSYNSYYGMYIKGINDGVMTFTLSSTATIGLNLLNATGQAGEPGTAYDIQLEAGSPATEYEPFTNTVYGGTFDAVNGVLTVEWELFDLGELDWTYADTANYRLWYADNAEMDADSTDLLCEQYKPSTDNTNNNTIRKYKTGSGAKRVSIHDDRYNEYSTEQFKTAMDGVYIAAKIATPYEIQLDPITVQTLIGDNTIWTDTNGSNTIKYKKKG